MPTISIIVPVCNVELKLRQCLDSLVNQTFQDIEIICVDDSSQDGCADILREYAERDARIFNIFHTTNMSTSQARKDGVMASSGKYLMFVDGDDFLEQNACQIASAAIEKSQSDILQFGVNIINCADVPESRIASNQRAVRPCLELIKEKNLVRACWEHNRFGFALWDKIYNGDLCRKAFSHLEDGFFPKAQDMYAFFLIAYYARTSCGMEDKLYNYNFGIGVTGSSFLDWPKFESLLTQHCVYEAIERFLIQEERREEYGDVLRIIYQRFLKECVNKWKSALRPEFASEGFQKLVETWGFEDVLLVLAEQNWFARDKMAEMMLNVDYFKHTQRTDEHLTIALYYRKISDGGAQRVVASLCNILAAMKDSAGQPLYRVVLITDEKKQKDEYPLDDSVFRRYLPANEASVQAAYRDRFKAWHQIIGEFKIDIVVDGMWTSPCTFWDMLCVKGHQFKPAFIIHCHSFCCLPYRFDTITGEELTYDYQICDGVVTLSECDRRFVSAFSDNVKCIVNPITFRADEVNPSNYEANTLVWVGRIAWEKQPLEAVYAMDYVVKEIPNAKLYMVGDGNEALTSELTKLIKRLGLQDNVVLTGFTQDVEAYYRKAMVYVGTSSFEGSPLTFCEAMSHSVPIVSYEMPWITFMRDGRGIVAVKQKRPDLLAKELIRFLKSPQLCKDVGNQGLEQVLETEQVDIGQEWKYLFDHIGVPTETRIASPEEAINYKYISYYQQMGKDQIQQKFSNGAEVKRLKARIETLENSTTFRVGKAVMYLPVRMKIWANKLMHK